MHSCTPREIALLRKPGRREQTQNQRHYTFDRLEKKIGVEGESALRSSLKGRERAMIVNQTRKGHDRQADQKGSWSSIRQERAMIVSQARKSHDRQ